MPSLLQLLDCQSPLCDKESRNACLSQEALGQTWVLYDLGVLAAMLICLITYSVYIHRLVDFSPQNTYEVYDSLGGAQARLLLPKKKNPTTYNGQHQIALSSPIAVHAMPCQSAATGEGVEATQGSD